MISAIGAVVTTIVALAFCVFWIWQFIQLMLLEDDLFPGRHDKPLWVAAFLVAFLIAPIAFFGWKHAIRTDHEEDRKSEAPQHSQETG